MYDLVRGRSEALPSHLHGKAASFGCLGWFWVLDPEHHAYFNIRTVRYSAVPIDIDRPGFHPLHPCLGLGLPTITPNETRVYSPPFAAITDGQGTARSFRLFHCGRPYLNLGPPAYRVGISGGLVWGDQKPGKRQDASSVYDIRTGRLYTWHLPPVRPGYVQYTEVTRYRVFVLRAVFEVLVQEPVIPQLIPVAFTVYMTQHPL